MIYSVTAQCLTPIGDISMLNASCGVYHQLIRATSERCAIEKAMTSISERYKDEAQAAAVCNYDAKTVTVLDEQAHIINHYWGFKGHEI